MQTTDRLSDEELVKAYIKGRNEAFDELLSRHQSKVYAYIFNIVKNRDIADDVFQETFVKCIVTLRQGRYTESGRFGAWLIRIAHNIIIDHFRQEKTANTVSTDDDGVDLLNRRDLCESNIEDHIIDTQICTDVRRIIQVLPTSQREVLMMRYYRGLSFKEIADITGVSINTALGRMRYAILNMRRIARENNIMLTA